MIFLTKIDNNVQFEKKAEAAPTAIFYNEVGEEVERVLLEGLSRCHDDHGVYGVGDFDDVVDVYEEDGEYVKVLLEGLSRTSGCDNCSDEHQKDNNCFKVVLPVDWFPLSGRSCSN